MSKRLSQAMRLHLPISKSALLYSFFAIIVSINATPLPSVHKAFHRQLLKRACEPISWRRIAIFYFANYVAHAVTLYTFPGESTFSIVHNILVALFVPTAGVARGLNAIFRHAILRKRSELGRAARAGALCMVVRSPYWVPRGDDREGLNPKDRPRESSSQGKA